MANMWTQLVFHSFKVKFINNVKLLGTGIQTHHQTLGLIIPVSHATVKCFICPNICYISFVPEVRKSLGPYVRTSVRPSIRPPFKKRRSYKANESYLSLPMNLQITHDPYLMTHTS